MVLKLFNLDRGARSGIIFEDTVKILPDKIKIHKKNQYRTDIQKIFKETV